MCRMYGFLSNEATKVECSLVHAQNALLHQSRADLRGETHPDGWGIVCYDDHVPRAERRATAAHQDIWFSISAERSYSKTVIAHIRQATVGVPWLENTHPFTHGCWTFAHNGTVTGFEQLHAGMEAEIEHPLRRSRKGTTDSELVFYWLLARMQRAGLKADDPCEEPLKLVEIVRSAIVHLDALSRRAVPNSAPKLNLLLTDGNLVLAVRWNHTLYYVERKGVHDCEVCGIPHVRHVSGTAYQAVVIASEPISHEDWREIPNHTIVVTQDGDDVDVYPMADIVAAPASGEHTSRKP